MSTPARKRGRPKRAILKVRQNITLTPSVLKKAKRLAFVDGMSLSAWMERMVRERIEQTTTAP